MNLKIIINDIANKVRSAVLTGLDVALTGAIVAGDTVLQAFGKIQNQINAINSSLGDKLEAGDNVSSLTNDAGYVDSAGVIGDIQFNDGASNLGADATLNFDSVNKLAKVPDLRIKESSGTNAPAANDETVLKMETEIVGADTIIRFFAQANSGEKVIIYSYIV